MSLPFSEEARAQQCRNMTNPFTEQPPEGLFIYLFRSGARVLSRGKVRHYGSWCYRDEAWSIM